MHLEYWPVVSDFFDSDAVFSENTQEVVLASCGLHYFLRSKSPVCNTPPRSLDREDANSNLIEGDSRAETNDGFKSI